MYPYYTSAFEIELKCSTEELHDYLKENIRNELKMTLNDLLHDKNRHDVWYGFVTKRKFFIQKRFGYKNGFRPILNAEYKETIDGCVIKGYYRISYLTEIFFLFLLLSGLYYSIKFNRIETFIVMVFIYFIFIHIIGYFLFKRDLNATKEEFERFITKIASV